MNTLCLFRKEIMDNRFWIRFTLMFFLSIRITFSVKFDKVKFALVHSSFFQVPGRLYPESCTVQLQTMKANRDSTTNESPSCEIIIYVRGYNLCRCVCLSEDKSRSKYIQYSPLHQRDKHTIFEKEYCCLNPLKSAWAIKYNWF